MNLKVIEILNKYFQKTSSFNYTKYHLKNVEIEKKDLEDLLEIYKEDNNSPLKQIMIRSDLGDIGIYKNETISTSVKENFLTMIRKD